MNEVTDELGERILLYIRENQPVTSSEISEHIDEHNRTVRRHLNALIECKLVYKRVDIFHIKGDARTKLYFAGN